MEFNGAQHLISHMSGLQSWMPETSICEFHYIAFWIQIHELFLDSINTHNVSKNGLRIGKVLEVEDPITEGIF